MTSKPKSKPVEERSRQANWQHIQKSIGNCPGCGGPCDINPRTQKRYSLCFLCRPAYNAAKKLLMKERRRAD